MVEGDPAFLAHHQDVEARGEALTQYLGSHDAPHEYDIRRQAFANKIGFKEAEFNIANIGAAVSGSSMVQEVRMGVLLAMNDHYRGTVPGYMQVEATLEEAVEEIETAVSAHPGYPEAISQTERVLGVLHKAAQVVYSRPVPPPITDRLPDNL